MTVKDDKNIYRLTSFYGQEDTPMEERVAGSFSKLEIRSKYSFTLMPQEDMKLPPLPRTRFKSKKHFLEKIKKYLLFS